MPRKSTLDYCLLGILKAGMDGLTEGKDDSNAGHEAKTRTTCLEAPLDSYQPIHADLPPKNHPSTCNKMSEGPKQDSKQKGHLKISTTKKEDSSKLTCMPTTAPLVSHLGSGRILPMTAVYRSISWAGVVPCRIRPCREDECT
jgi:hypothetical protein